MASSKPAFRIRIQKSRDHRHWEHIATYVISIQLYVSCLLRANRTKGPLHQCSDALDRRKKPGLDVHTHERIGKRDSSLGKISIHSFPDVQH